MQIPPVVPILYITRETLVTIFLDHTLILYYLYQFKNLLTVTRRIFTLLFCPNLILLVTSIIFFTQHAIINVLYKTY